MNQNLTLLLHKTAKGAFHDELNYDNIPATYGLPPLFFIIIIYC